jgi:hypothetical protein
MPLGCTTIRTQESIFRSADLIGFAAELLTHAIYASEVLHVLRKKPSTATLTIADPLQTHPLLSAPMPLECSMGCAQETMRRYVDLAGFTANLSVVQELYASNTHHVSRARNH